MCLEVLREAAVAFGAKALPVKDIITALGTGMSVTLIDPSLFLQHQYPPVHIMITLSMCRCY